MNGWAKVGSGKLHFFDNGRSLCETIEFVSGQPNFENLPPPLPPRCERCEERLAKDGMTWDLGSLD